MLQMHSCVFVFLLIITSNLLIKGLTVRFTREYKKILSGLYVPPFRADPFVVDTKSILSFQLFHRTWKWIKYLTPITYSLLPNLYQELS